MRSGRLIRVAIVAMIVAVGAGAAALATFGGSSGGDFPGSPVPPLYDDAQLAAVDAPLKAAEARGHRVAKAWLDDHPVASDAQFASWAVRVLGAPPGGKAPPAELAQLKQLAANRDA